MIPCFGPFYPSVLQTVVNHAERLARALHEFEGEVLGSLWSNPNDPTDAEVWLLGRGGEVEAFVGDLTREYAEGYFSAELAARTLQRYVDLVHEGLAHHFGARSPACCATAAATKDAAALRTRDVPFAAAVAVASIAVTTPTPTPNAT